jgi:23S rRNA (cytidine1920-2'-O)/16S rRNA (cytidine1409-2'-O)-methyltransferase
MKQRLDRVVKDRRLIRSRSRAQQAIASGLVQVNGKVILRPGHPTDPEAKIELLSSQQFVSRGGEKLAAALHKFNVDPSGLVCLDIGSAKGGFVDCLLKSGASRVHSVDVGHDQIDARLRKSPKVLIHEGINARYLVPQDIGEPIDLATIDVSFISLALILPPLVDIMASRHEIIALVKPQFEAGKDRLPADGVVKNANDRKAILNEIYHFIEHQTPWKIVEEMTSPIQGRKGNTEFLVHLYRKAQI